jgi:uncharacterized membrane protein YqgA involved in biofilm formation
LSEPVIGIGTGLNVAGILVGAAVGMSRWRVYLEARERAIKGLLGVLCVYVGLSLVWQSLHGGPGRVLRQILIVVLALTLGRIAGRLAGLQRASNRLGQFASRSFEAAQKRPRPRPADGFLTGAAVFCAAPLSVLGALQDGFGGDPKLLAVKAIVDAMGSMAFARFFGPGLLLAAVPVLAWQGTITLLALWLKPWMVQHALLDPLGAVAGFLTFCIALIILDLKKFAVADYLPSLVWGPLLAWWLGY